MENYWKKKAEQYRDYSIQLKTQRDDAFDQLKSISVGLATSGSGTTWDHQTKMQYDAATFLRKQAVKSVSEPKGYFYP